MLCIKLMEKHIPITHYFLNLIYRMSPQSSERIIKTYPELSAFQVEYEGQVFDCNRCMGKGKCCGAQNDQFNYYLACQKCRCQNLHNVLDNSREKNPKVKQTNCDDCDDTQFNAQYCENVGHLNNNLKANITDCSNNFLNLGKNSQITDVELRSECNVGGESSVDVVTPQGATQTSSPLNMNYVFIGGGALFVLLIIFLLF